MLVLGWVTAWEYMVLLPFLVLAELDSAQWLIVKEVLVRQKINRKVHFQY